MVYSVTLEHENVATYFYDLLSERSDTYLSPSAL